MITLNPKEKETLRHVLLEYLVERIRFFFDAAAIARALPRRGYVDFNIDEACVRDALDLLAEKGLVKSKDDELGSTKFFRATADGVLAEERRQVEG